MDFKVCGDCTYDIPVGSHCCPHCGRAPIYWNVEEAGDPTEQKALQDRYTKALEDAEDRGAREAVDTFEAAISNSRAVITRSLEELERLASSDRELYSTYYKLLAAEVRLPRGEKWDRLRRIADETLFPGYKEHVRFAALSINGAGLPAYGNAVAVLREDMTAHRASVFEENSALFMKRHNYNLPRGFRSTWSDRLKLCVAKIAQHIHSSTAPCQFGELLLSSGESPGSDSFVEVHIWGPLSIRTFERAIVLEQSPQAMLSRVRALQERFAAYGVTLEIRG